MEIQPVTLEGTWARLEPLRIEHAAALHTAAQDEAIWRYVSSNPSASVGAMEGWIARAREAQTAGSELPFVIFARAADEVVGSTRYMTITPEHRGLEIGWTWLARQARRTAVNTECKYLLLRHAFETLGMIRVQLKTDSRNLISQRAIARLGAVREGILRKHMIYADGYQRDTVMFSIIEEEWPTVRAHLEMKLRAAYPAAR